MSSFPSRLVLCLILCAAPGVTALAADEPAGLRQILNSIIPGEQPDSIGPSPVQGLYEVVYGTEVFYITADGRYVLQGDLMDLKSRTNLSEEKRSAARRHIMATINPATAIIFRPEKTRYVIDVFTDIDCPYCRKMHKEIDQYLKRGIEIHYLAYPRTGANTESYYKAVSVWCSKDRQAALTFAKSGGKVERKSCNNPVLDHMAKAGQIGITGTPTLVLPDGSVIAGYVPADQLIQILDERIGG